MAAQAFISRDDVTAFYRERVRQALNVDDDYDFDDDEGPATDLFNRAVSAANELIHTHLIDRYALPLATVPDNLKEIGATIAFYTMIRTRPDVGVDADIDAHKAALAHLKALSRGDIFIENPRRNVTEAAEQEIRSYRMDDGCATTPLRDLLQNF